MNTRIFEAFESRERQVTEYMAGCGMRYGMDCTCGPGCRCKNCPIHSNGGVRGSTDAAAPAAASSATEEELRQAAEIQAQIDAIQPNDLDDGPIHVEQKMNFFGMEPPPPVAEHDTMRMSFATVDSHRDGGHRGSYKAQRNPSVISYGMRHMSMTSETTFGRAMSGLSALSIDWENLDDFDLEVDHSAGVNNLEAYPTRTDGKRSSLRRTGDYHDPEAHVSFKI